MLQLQLSYLCQFCKKTWNNHFWKIFDLYKEFTAYKTNTLGFNFEIKFDSLKGILWFGNGNQIRKVATDLLDVAKKNDADDFTFCCALRGVWDSIKIVNCEKNM